MQANCKKTPNQTNQTKKPKATIQGKMTTKSCTQ